MGIKDHVLKVVTTYKADTKPHRDEIKKLDGAEKKHAQANLKRLDDNNSKLDKQIATLGKVGLAVGAVAVAYGVAADSFKTYAHNSKLASQTVGVNLAGLRKATNGLVDDTRLLEFAASGMNGTFKLSQKQMEETARAAVVLRRGNTTLEESLTRIQKATEEGSTEPLKDLGIVITGSKSGTQAGLTDALAAMNKEVVAVGGNFNVVGDDVTQSKIEIVNSMDSIKDSIGRVVIALGPLIDALSFATKLMANLLGGDRKMFSNSSDIIKNDIARLQAGVGGGIGSGADGLLAASQNPEAFKALLGLPGTVGAALSGARDFANQPLFGDGNKSGHFSEQFRTGGFAAAKRGRKGVKRSGKKRGSGSAKSQNFGSLDGIDSVLASSANLLNKASQTLSMLGSEGQAIRLEEEQAIQADYIAQVQAETALTNEFFADIASFRAENDNVLQQIFGAPSEIDQRTISISQLAGAFGGLTGSFGAGVDAMITGSDSFANAFKNAIGESMRALSVEMAVNSLKHLGYGLASVAFLDGRGAAAHFAASTQFGAGALAAGAGASLLGAGQARSSAGGQTSAPPTTGTSGVGSSSGSNDNKSTTQVIIMGNDFEGMNWRQRKSQWRQTTRDAGITVEGDAIING